MSLPDFTNEVLTYLTDGAGSNENWDTNNFSPAPTLIDGDEMTYFGSGERAKDASVVNQNIITVDSAPVGTNEIIGTSFQYRVTRPVRVILEGYHADGGGQVADKDEFNSMVTESRRAIHEERNFPTSSNTITHLWIRNESDESPGEPVDANYFRYEYEVVFVGHEDLP